MYRLGLSSFRDSCIFYTDGTNPYSRNDLAIFKASQPFLLRYRNSLHLFNKVLIWLMLQIFELITEWKWIYYRCWVSDAQVRIQGG